MISLTAALAAVRRLPAAHAQRPVARALIGDRREMVVYLRDDVSLRAARC